VFGRSKRIEQKLDQLIERQQHMSTDLDNLKAAAAAQKDLLAAQGALLNRAVTTLDDLAAKVAALPADPAAIAQLAADIAANNDAIRAENAQVAAELDKVAPPSTPPPPTPPPTAG
jgi:peptidoglycan hydrolase CwlO-like protein